jgi:hypothetical protein
MSTDDTTGTFDLAATHDALLAAFEASGITIAMSGDDNQPFSLSDWHAAITARIEQLESANRTLSAQNAALRVDAEENAQLRAELVCAKKAAAFRRRKPTKTFEFERDGKGAVIRSHMFEGGR